MAQEIQAFLFDLDGVLTDTAEYHYLGWQRIADENGIPFSREENDAMRGLSRRDSLTVLLKGRVIDEETANAWMARKNEYYIASLEHISPRDLLPGVLDFLTASKSLGLKIAVGSASKNARVVLDKLDILRLFDAVGDGYSIVNSKPAPDLFLWTAGRLNVNPGRAVVFEDAMAGIAAARQGGFYTVGLGDAAGDDADLKLATLAGVTPQQVIDHLTAPKQS
jgi:beta-phosphoglucomutase